MAKFARENYQTGFQSLQTEAGKEADLEDASMALYHLMRDWSAQGKKERQAVFPPVLEGLEKHFGGRRRRSGEKEEKEEEKKVLVPGSGTGRLASDIADLGMSVHHNYFGSFFLWSWGKRSHICLTMLAHRLQCHSQ